MPDITVLAFFIPTFFFVSITPGMCMTLAMTLGMKIGYRKTLMMMLGEVLGVAIVAICSMYGVATFVLNNPKLFSVFKYIGGAYLIYLGVKSFLAKVEVENQVATSLHDPKQLFVQGFVTAFSNPKGWAFMITLLPPFIDSTKSFSAQLIVLVTIILISEFVCMSMYALGGKKLNTILLKTDKAHWLNKIAGGLLCFVGIWLALS